MPTKPTLRCTRTLLAATLSIGMLAVVACSGVGTKLQPPTASIQQLTMRSDGQWDAVVRFQNYSYDAGMHVYAIDATLGINGQPAGHIAFSPALDIPAMDADIGTVTFQPDPAGSAALAAAGHNAVQYTLKGTLSVGKSPRGGAQSFPLDAKGFISPVPGVSNIWR